mgnify:CR=1 FL=1
MEGIVVDVKKNYLHIISSIFIVLLVIITILLTIQNYKLKSIINDLTNLPDLSLKSADMVEDFQALTLSGDTVNISFTDSSISYLFFVLTTSCPHCINNLKYLDIIAE